MIKTVALPVSKVGSQLFEDILANKLKFFEERASGIL